MEETMKLISILTIVACIPLAGCFGNSASENTVIGQVKKVKHVTPLICDDRYDVDVSLGMMRNGVGSMSTQDMWISVPAELVGAFTVNADSGAPVQITYDTPRLAWCWQDEWATAIKPVK
jgi:hypothetical protein